MGKDGEEKAEARSVGSIPRSRSHDEHRRSQASGTDSDSSFSLTSTVLSLVAAGAAAIGGKYSAQSEQTWPFAPETFVKMAQQITEERKKRFGLPAGFRGGSDGEVFGSGVSSEVNWVVIVGNHQAQAQQVASRLMAEGISRVTVIRGNGFVHTARA